MNRFRYGLMGAAILALILIVAGSACSGVRSGVAHTYGTIEEGYVLLSPYRLNHGTLASEGRVELIDREGIVVHSWSTTAPALSAILRDNGNIFVTLTPPADQAALPGPGGTGVIQELDWNGKVLWEHKDPLMMTDFDALPDGSVAYLRWEKTSLQFASRVRGGFKTATTSMWANTIVVVGQDGVTRWEWKMSEVLTPEKYLISDSVPRQEFAHANSLRYVVDNPITHTPAFLLSVRHINTVFLIDAETGVVLWESPQGIFSLQHDATITPEGTLLAFDNEFGRSGVPALLSRVLELSLPTGNVLWSYDGGETLTSKAQFASSIMGGAERLPNGNTLVTVSTAGRIEEVTSEGKAVWDYAKTERDEDGEAPILFRSRFYSPEGTAWGLRVLPARTLSSLFCEAR